ncbi:hypothetical protein [Kocuria sp.]|uniref:hypothetical protein n=1 Tax=Kocuria sp. TaxID=1871328 RepID=UPI0026E03AE6|nr:hypothetical protein [Kocuria sp.]MDO5366845.1 hypothetical protein [Kocuria sp.]
MSDDLQAHILAAAALTLAAHEHHQKPGPCSHDHTAIPMVILGRMKLRLAKELHDKLL